MVARATRQFVEVLGTGDGTARMSQQYVEVLWSLGIETAATDTLALSELAVGGLVVIPVNDSLVISDEASVILLPGLVEVSDTIAASDAASREAIFVRAPTDVLDLSDSIDVDFVWRCQGFDSLASIIDTATSEVVKPVYDSLVLMEYAVVERIYTIADTLSLSDTGSYLAVYARSAQDTLSLADAAEEVFNRGEDTLSITDVAEVDGVFYRRATDTFSISDTAQGIRPKIGIATDTLSLTETAALIYGVSDTLSLSDEAVGVTSLFGLDTLSLSDNATVVTNHVGATSSLVDLSDTADCGGTYNRGTGDALLYLHDTAFVTGPRYCSAEDDLQAVYQEYDPVSGEFYDYLIGLQDLAVAFVLRGESFPVVDNLSLGDHATGIRIRADALPGVAEDTLALTDLAWSSLTPISVDVLSLTETATPVLSKLFVDSLSLSDSAVYHIARILTVVDTLTLGEASLWYNPYADVECTYHPFVGGGTGGPTPPPGELAGVELPIPGVTDRFTLVYPVVGPFDDTLILRAPQFGNRDRLQMNRISRETRGGTLVVFADPIWPKIQSLAVQFEGLSWDEVAGLLVFMEDHLGLEIGLLDWEQRYWKGVIVNTTDPAVHDGKWGYSVSFEFEGELTTYSP